MKYSLDTSALIEPWVRLYPPDVFPQVWEALEGLIATGAVRASIEVRRELERQSDALSDWTHRVDGLFVEVDEPQARKVKEIVNAYPDLVKPNSTKSQADPFVIALAELGGAGVKVVAYEGRAKANAAPRIPNVCAARRIEVVSMVDVLRAEGFTFSAGG
ncbi:MAG: DUF4411 family protein [Proteobacteria bacterium]|nr:DUF4411 family protein [Pseudomonadota bacterium]